MIVMDEKIVGVWFIGMGNQDWMAGIRELVPDEKYEIKYRFRYYEDDKAFDSEDRKNWYQGTLSGTRNYVILSARNVAKRLAEISNGELFEVVNAHNFDAFLKEFQNMPFAYMRMTTPEERQQIIKENDAKKG